MLSGKLSTREVSNRDQGSLLKNTDAPSGSTELLQSWPGYRDPRELCSLHYANKHFRNAMDSLLDGWIRCSHSSFSFSVTWNQQRHHRGLSHKFSMKKWKGKRWLTGTRGKKTKTPLQGATRCSQLRAATIPHQGRKKLPRAPPLRVLAEWEFHSHSLLRQPGAVHGVPARLGSGNLPCLLPLPHSCRAPYSAVRSQEVRRRRQRPREKWKVSDNCVTAGISSGRTSRTTPTRSPASLESLRVEGAHLTPEIESPLPASHWPNKGSQGQPGRKGHLDKASASRGFYVRDKSAVTTDFESYWRVIRGRVHT